MHLATRVSKISAVVLLGTLALCILLSAGCSKLSSVPEFGKLGIPVFGSSGTSTLVSTYLSAVDAGNYDVNSDGNTSCVSQWNAVGTISRGCMQPPPIVRADNRWFIGFTQNYLYTDPTATVTTGAHFSLFSSMSSLITGLFTPNLSTTLGIIDTGSGIDSNAENASARYVRYARFPNEDVIAVYFQEFLNLGGGGVPYRVVHASIYNSSTNTWGPATQLGTYDGTVAGSRKTDSGNDFNSYLTTFCRPSVATAGDGSAMVAWCEERAAAAQSLVRYNIYKNGAWQNTASALTAAPATLISGASTTTLPTFSGKVIEFSNSFAVNNIFQASISTGATSGNDIATVKAVNAFGGYGEFNIVKNAAGTVLGCSTLQNLSSAILAKEVYNSSSSTFKGKTLSQLGVSLVVNPSCVETTASTWILHMYFNQSLKNIFSATNYNVVNGITKSTDDGATYGAAGLAMTSIPTTAQSYWQWSSMVEVAGDLFGNYSLIRSMPAPYFRSDGYGNSGEARMLVGHSYSSASGWLTTLDPGGASQLKTSFISRIPYCYNGANNIACSVKNPRMTMSDSGNGLILFHQKQLERYADTTGTIRTNNPNRLWFATYSPSTGYSSTASPIDEDVRCGTSSVANDQNVCETASFGSLTDVSSSCQVTEEPVTALAVTQLTHDVPPIALAMNSSGQAVVAYNKATINSSTGDCTDTFVGTYVRTFDPLSGFSANEQIADIDSGHNMHAAVAIAENGNIAVVWERAVNATTKYVELKTKVNGTWSALTHVNSSSSPGINSKDSMLPSVGIQSSGEVVVSFTYGETGSRRRQYVKHYMAR